MHFCDVLIHYDDGSAQLFEYKKDPNKPIRVIQLSYNGFHYNSVRSISKSEKIIDEQKALTKIVSEIQHEVVPQAECPWENLKIKKQNSSSPQKIEAKNQQSQIQKENQQKVNLERQFLIDYLDKQGQKFLDNQLSRIFANYQIRKEREITETFTKYFTSLDTKVIERNLDYIVNYSTYMLDKKWQLKPIINENLLMAFNKKIQQNAMKNLSQKDTSFTCTQLYWRPKPSEVKTVKQDDQNIPFCSVDFATLEQAISQGAIEQLRQFQISNIECDRNGWYWRFGHQSGNQTNFKMEYPACQKLTLNQNAQNAQNDSTKIKCIFDNESLICIGINNDFVGTSAAIEDQLKPSQLQIDEDSDEGETPMKKDLKKFLHSLSVHEFELKKGERIVGVRGLLRSERHHFVASMSFIVARDERFQFLQGQQQSQQSNRRAIKMNEQKNDHDDQ